MIRFAKLRYLRRICKSNSMRRNRKEKFLFWPLLPSATKFEHFQSFIRDSLSRWIMES